MEQKVRICLQFSNPNQGGGPPSSANPLQTLPRWSHTSNHRRRRHLRPTQVSVPSSDDALRSPPPPAPLSSANDAVPCHERRCTRYQYQQKAERRYQSASGSYTGRPPIPSRRHRHVDRIPAARITLFFPTFLCPRAVSFRQTSLPNYLLVLAPNAFVKRWNKLVDSSQIPARLSPPRTRRPRKLPLTNVLFIPRHGSCTPHSTNFITRVFPLHFYFYPFSLSFSLRFRFERAICTRINISKKEQWDFTFLYNEWLISLRSLLPSSKYLCLCEVAIHPDAHIRYWSERICYHRGDMERKIAGCFCFKWFECGTIVIIHWYF